MDDFDFVDDTPDPFDPVVADLAARAVETRAELSNEAVQSHLRRVKQAYTAVFKTGTPTSHDIEFVMRDLFWFCRGAEHFFPDARLQDVMAGRKQVLQRISEYTSFDFATLHRMYVEAQK